MATVIGTQSAQGGQEAPSAVSTVPIGAAAGQVNIGDPAPLGLAGFGLTTLVLSVINAGMIDATAVPIVLGLALPFGGIAQFVAGLWAFRRGNTFAATAFCSFGAFWISYWLIVAIYAGQVVAAPNGASTIHTILGMYLFAWGVFTAYMLIASLAGAKAVTAVFFLLTLTFFALAIGEWAKSTTWTNIGGYLGIATAVVALYTSFADVTNANFKRVILPTF